VVNKPFGNWASGLVSCGRSAEAARAVTVASLASTFRLLPAAGRSLATECFSKLAAPFRDRWIAAPIAGREFCFLLFSSYRPAALCLTASLGKLQKANSLNFARAVLQIAREFPSLAAGRSRKRKRVLAEKSIFRRRVQNPADRAESSRKTV
jgi:hypothetical protein